MNVFLSIFFLHLVLPLPFSTAHRVSFSPRLIPRPGVSHRFATAFPPSFNRVSTLQLHHVTLSTVVSTAFPRLFHRRFQCRFHHDFHRRSSSHRLRLHCFWIDFFSTTAVQFTAVSSDVSTVFLLLSLRFQSIRYLVRESCRELTVIFNLVAGSSRVLGVNRGILSIWTWRF